MLHLRCYVPLLYILIAKTRASSAMVWFSPSPAVVRFLLRCSSARATRAVHFTQIHRTSYATFRYCTLADDEQSSLSCDSHCEKEEGQMVGKRARLRRSKVQLCSRQNPCAAMDVEDPVPWDWTIFEAAQISC